MFHAARARRVAHEHLSLHSATDGRSQNDSSALAFSFGAGFYAPAVEPDWEVLAMYARALAFIFPLAAVTANLRADPLAPADAASHIGQVATVCGFVASTNYVPQSTGAPTFLDFGRAYPHAVFTALILGVDRDKFGSPEQTLGSKEVCVTGEIRSYGGTPQVILTQPNQLSEK